MTRRRLLSLAPLAVATAVVLAALVVTPAAQPPAAPTGPLRIADVWPSARVATVSGALPSGEIYDPMVVLDPELSIGLSIPLDYSASSLAVVSPGAVRVLRDQAGPVQATIAAVAVDGGTAYWLEVGSATAGEAQTSIWAAPLDGTSSARRLSTDTSEVKYYGSAHDLQFVEGVLYWSATAADGTGEVRSLDVATGRVAVQTLDKPYAMLDWPWVTDIYFGRTGDVELVNVSSGERRTVAAGPDEIVTCSPSWCRIATMLGQRIVRYEALELTSGDRQLTGGNRLSPSNADVALLDRFEILGDIDLESTQARSRLWIHDLVRQQRVLLDEYTNGVVRSNGPYLWWSTGENEVLTWRLLDLRQLT